MRDRSNLNRQDTVLGGMILAGFVMIGKRCSQATRQRSWVARYAQGSSSSIWLFGWSLMMRVMTSAR